MKPDKVSDLKLILLNVVFLNVKKENGRTKRKKSGDIIRFMVSKKGKNYPALRSLFKKS